MVLSLAGSDAGLPVVVVALWYPTLRPSNETVADQLGATRRRGAVCHGRTMAFAAATLLVAALAMTRVKEA